MMTQPVTVMTASSGLVACGVQLHVGPLDDPGGAIGHDLAHGQAHLGGVEAHHGNGVRAHGGRVLHHAVERLAPRILVELDVGADLAADEALEEGGDVAADAPGPDGEPEYLADRLHHPRVWDVFGGRDDHGLAGWG